MLKSDRVISLNEFERIIKFRQSRGEDGKIFYHRGKTFGYVHDVYAKLKRRKWQLALVVLEEVTIQVMG